MIESAVGVQTPTKSGRGRLGVTAAFRRGALFGHGAACGDTIPRWLALATIGAIVATDRRVLVESRFRPAASFGLAQLTGAIARIGLFSRYLVLMGRGLPAKIGFSQAGRSNDNATIVQVNQIGAARRAAADITRLVISAQQTAAISKR